MKDYFLIATCLVAWVILSTMPFLPAAKITGHHAAVARMKVVGGGPTYLLNENMEGSGTPSGWTDTGSPSWDYTTSPAPLAGSESLRVNSSASTVYTIYDFGADYSSFYLYFIFRIETFDTFNDTICLRNSTGTNLLLLRQMNAAGSWRLTGGSNTTVTLNNSTTYHVWLEFVSATTSDLYLSTSSTKPGTPSYSVAANTGSVRDIVFGIQSSSTSDLFFDNALADNVTIGSQ